MDFLTSSPQTFEAVLEVIAAATFILAPGAPADLPRGHGGVGHGLPWDCDTTSVFHVLQSSNMTSFELRACLQQERRVLAQHYRLLRTESGCLVSSMRLSRHDDMDVERMTSGLTLQDPS